MIFPLSSTEMKENQGWFNEGTNCVFHSQEPPKTPFQNSGMIQFLVWKFTSNYIILNQKQQPQTEALNQQIENHKQMQI